MGSRSSSVLAAIVICSAGRGCSAGVNRPDRRSIMADTVPRILVEWLWPFVGCFTASTWIHVPVLVAGAVLCPGRRTVTATLRVMGLDQTGLSRHWGSGRHGQAGGGIGFRIEEL